MRIDASNADEWRYGLVGGGFYVRAMIVRYGQAHQGHWHWVDHIANVTKPPLRITCRDLDTGEEKVFEVFEPAKIPVLARWVHSFEALSPDGAEWECWFAEAEADKEYPGQQVPWTMERDDG
jgi:hypothetical protein